MPPGTDEEMMAILAFLLPYLDPSLSQSKQKGVLDINAKQVNLAQDQTSMLFSPTFGAMSGTFQEQPEQEFVRQEYPESTRRVDGWLNSGDPILQMIASGLQSGELDPLSAKRLIRNAAAEEGSTMFGEDPLELARDVDLVFDEIVKNESGRNEFNLEQDRIETSVASKPKDDVFTKAGFPQPSERYDQSNIPQTAAEATRTTTRTADWQTKQADLERYLDRNPSSLRGQDGSPITAGQGRDTANGRGKVAAPSEKYSPRPVSLETHPERYRFLDHEGKLLDVPALRDINPATGKSYVKEDADARGGLADKLSNEVLKLFAGASTRAPLTVSADRADERIRRQAGPQKVDKKKMRLQNDALIAKGKAVASVSGGGHERAYAAQGRTPLKDALAARAQFLRMMGLSG